MPNRDTPFRQGRVRLVDVAERAGVTKSVASRVLNDDATLSVRQETRDRVWAAARKLGYRAHAGARALTGAQARAMALLIPDLTNPVYSRITRGACQQARQYGYVMLLAEDTETQEADETFTELVASGRVDGLLVASARPDHRLLPTLGGAGIPHVYVNRAVPGSGRNVLMDLEAASVAAVQHLVRLGHRRIGHVSGPATLAPAQAREAGFLSCGRGFGLAAMPVARGEFSEEGGADAAARLLREHQDLTAIYASTLSQTIGVLHAVRASGLRVPDDISVVGYDDLPLAGYLDPPLTTVAMPLVELGATAVDALVGQLQGKQPTDVTIPTSPEVVARSSTGPAA